MLKLDATSISPGILLRDFLKDIFPFRTEPNSFLLSIDNALIGSGDVARTNYDSSINYIVRRLIRTTQWLKRRYDPTGNNSSVYRRELRTFLKHETNFRQPEQERLFTLLILCEETTHRNIKENELKDRIEQAIKSRELACYICGVDLDFETKGEHNSAEVEHLWPHAMGGLNDKSNTKMACHNCNQRKKNKIDASDYHYEEICMATEEGDTSFSKEFNREYKLAIWAKADFKCTSCKQGIYEVGPLQFARRNKSDSWHFFNIDAYCDQHKPKP